MPAEACSRAELMTASASWLLCVSQNKIQIGSTVSTSSLWQVWRLVALDFFVEGEEFVEDRGKYNIGWFVMGYFVAAKAFLELCYAL